MSHFQPVTLSFNGVNYTIAANQILCCIAQVEDVITLQDLTNPKRVPTAKLSQAYATALRFAGANVTDEDVYVTVFEKAGASLLANAVSGLLSMMIPPTKIQEKVNASTSGEKKPKAKPKPKTRSS